MDKKRSKKEFQHWSRKEDFKYNLYMILKNKELITTDIKKSGFYVGMSDFIQTKQKTQCRSHHQKKIKSLRQKSKVTNKTELEMLNIRKFYQTEYTHRILKSDHLLTQLRKHLEQRIKAGSNSYEKQAYYELWEKAPEIVEQLNLDEFEEINDESSQQAQSENHQIVENQITAPTSEYSINHSQTERLVNQAEYIRMIEEFNNRDDHSPENFFFDE